MKVWTKQEDEFVVSNYKLNTIKIILGVLKNRTWRAIGARAQLLGIKREMGASYANICYFDKWNENMAYILGFIYADGCIIDRKKSTGDEVLYIALANADYDHLVKIRDKIAPNKKIWVYYKKLNNKYYRIDYLRIGSRYLCKRLKDLGVKNRKSKVLEFPHVPKKYLSHFIRGYFDGDGSFLIYRNEPRLSFCSGTKVFLDYISLLIANNLGLSKKNIIYGKVAGAYYLHYHTRESIVVGEWLYNNSSIHLGRKYDTYLEAKNEIYG